MSFRDILHAARLAARRKSPDVATPESLAHAFAQQLDFTPPGDVPAISLKANALMQYFDAHEHGLGIWKWSHYFDAYERHLSKFVGSAATLLEIGIYSGGSLEMWRHYLGPLARIVGVDIEAACRAYGSDDCEIVIGDQADRAFWASFRNRFSGVDVIIDDGGHTYEQQRVTLEETLPLLRAGGVYICEDVHGQGNEFARFALTLAEELNHFDTTAPSVEPGQLETSSNAFQRTIASAHFYPYLVVLEKTPLRVDRLTAPRRGTRWQPFLRNNDDYQR